LLVGPQSATTTSLEIASADLESSSVRVQCIVRRRPASAQSVDTFTSPSYLLAKVSAPISTVSNEIRVAGNPALQERALGFLRGEMLRLGWLVLLGAGVYVVTSMLLGAEELKSIATRILKRKVQP